MIKLAENPKQNKGKFQQPKDDFKGIVRIQSTDIKGHYKVQYGIALIKGIGDRVADYVCLKSGINPNKKIGDLTDAELQILDNSINGLKDSLPTWMKNRRKDPETGTDSHLLTSDINLTVDNDIKTMKKIKSYRGVRHMFRLPVRGQRTKSNFRRNKKKIRKKK